MKLTLTCPHAKYNAVMRIQCEKSGTLCANQRWKPCKGWSVLTEWADDCPARKEQANERKTSKKRKN